MTKQGNVDNLRPVRSKEEATERGQAGGIASGKARREKKTLADALRKVLDESIGADNLTRREAIAARVLKRLYDEGDIRDVKVLAEILGEVKQTIDIPGLQLNVNTSKEGADGIDKL